jgi:hypothetical protein
VPKRRGSGPPSDRRRSKRNWIPSGSSGTGVYHSGFSLGRLRSRASSCRSQRSRCRFRRGKKSTRSSSAAA